MDAQLRDNADADGLARVWVPELDAWGVRVTRPFARGEYVCEYAGELLGLAEAEAREEGYARAHRGDAAPRCYMFFFQHRGQTWCVDATADTGRLGRLINHRRRRPNLQPRKRVVDGVPRLALVAARPIAATEELRFDYGDRDPEAVAAHPWLGH